MEPSKNIFNKFVAGSLIIAILSVIFFSAPKKANAQAGVLSGCFTALTGMGLGSVMGAAQDSAMQAVSGTVGALPIPGLASVPVSDMGTHMNLQQINVQVTTQTQKESCFDALATFAAKMVIHNISSSIIDWANSGFDGNPAFISDVSGFFKDTADQIAGGLIEGSELAFLCDPFRLNIQLSLSQRGRFADQIRCTLSDVIDNITNFTDNSFSSGGWNSWYTMTSQPQNNPYGAEFLARVELDSRMSSNQGKLEQELSWGNGWLSSKDENGNIVTPGTTIEKAVSNVLGSDLRQLEMAHEFDDIINAITGALLKKVVGAAGFR